MTSPSSASRRTKPKSILFNLSGHGLLDLKAYEDKLSGALIDYSPTDETILQALASLPKVSLVRRSAVCRSP